MPQQSPVKIRHKMKNTGIDRLYMGITYTIVAVFALTILYPLVYVLSASFSSPGALVGGRVFFFPVEPGLQGYQAVFQNKNVWRGYFNTVIYTAVGTSFQIVVTMMGAFVLSRKEFPLKVPVTVFFMITMFFGGGLIPTYLLVSKLGMVNTIWALTVPGAFSMWSAVMARTFIKTTIPEELFEATSLDGGDFFDYLIRIVVPLSGPIIAVLALGFAVGHWNSYFGALIYINDMEKFPLQIILRSILIENTQQMSGAGMEGVGASAMASDVMAYTNKQYLAELLKYSLIVVSSAPLLILYPFLQRFFVKGVMIGSLKG
jgi:multiple sugar transport system permease protein/putative aldouronate transport system permease protein